jgi:short-subunit dehydrogenase
MSPDPSQPAPSVSGVNRQPNPSDPSVNADHDAGPPERVVLITGASSGIGSEVARLFAQRSACSLGGAPHLAPPGGANAPHRVALFLVGRDPTRLQRVATETGARAIQADLTRPEELARVAEAVAQHSSRLDVLVNCAGRLEVGPTPELGASTAEELIRVNFLAPVALTDACLPLLRAGVRAAIVNVASVAGRASPPFMAAYSASKHALVAYSRTLRQELRSAGIHVGLVLPAPVNTPMLQASFGGPYYPRPPGLPVVTAAEAAQAVLACAERRYAERTVPRWLGGVIGLQAAFPGLTDLLYRVMGVDQITGAASR